MGCLVSKAERGICFLIWALWIANFTFCCHFRVAKVSLPRDSTPPPMSGLETDMLAKPWYSQSVVPRPHSICITQWLVRTSSSQALALSTWIGPGLVQYPDWPYAHPSSRSILLRALPSLFWDLTLPATRLSNRGYSWEESGEWHGFCLHFWLLQSFILQYNYHRYLHVPNVVGSIHRRTCSGQTSCESHLFSITWDGVLICPALCCGDAPRKPHQTS